MKAYGSTSENGEKVHLLTEKEFNLWVGLMHAWGFGFNAVVCMNFTQLCESWNPILAVLVYLTMFFWGVGLSSRFKNPVVSFIGYNMVVLPIGAVLSVFLKNICWRTVTQVFQLMTFTVLLLLVISIIQPWILLSMRRCVLICLFGVIAAEFFIGAVSGRPSIVQCIVSLVICGYLGYDWSRAQIRLDKTIDGAIDTATELYLHMLVQLLAVFTNKNSRH